MKKQFVLFSVLMFVTIGVTSAKQPNIIVLLADDLGYADLSCFGSTAVKTPNLDALAAGGLKMTQFYSASGVCTPTRVSILTGRYPLRFDVRRHFRDDEAHLPPGTVTLPKRLKQAGYVTAHVGKWHLGGLHMKHFKDRANSIPGPHQHGFDHYVCQIEEQPLRGDMGRERTLFRKGGTCLVIDDKPIGPDHPYYNRHFTDINGDETVALIEDYHETGRPFFINVWWMVPHKPYEPAPEPHWSRTAVKGISDDQHRFRSMVEHMDAKIGAIVAKLDELNIRENTLLLFTSDNGAAYEGQIGNLKGGKTDLHEGGIRVPLIANWPGRIEPGTTSSTIGSTIDILPTLCAAAGVKASDTPLDGINLWPHISTGQPVSDDDRGTLLWQLDIYKVLQRHYPKPEPYPSEVARRGKWKLLSKNGEPLELFDIEADPAETNNRLRDFPEVVDSLKKEINQFLKAPRITSS